MSRTLCCMYLLVKISNDLIQLLSTGLMRGLQLLFSFYLCIMCLLVGKLCCL